jgi:hypothetical protein
MGQLARIFVLSLALGVATQAGAGPPSEQPQLARATCFLNEIHHPQAGEIAEATVFIAAVALDGTLASEGTGFVVSDSADGGTQGSRIVTAAHVIEDIDITRDGQRWVVFFSDGMPLGQPRKVLQRKPRELSVGGFDLVENDIAVIEIPLSTMSQRVTASSRSKVFRSLAATKFWSASQANPWCGLGLFGGCRNRSGGASRGCVNRCGVSRPRDVGVGLGPRRRSEWLSSITTCDLARSFLGYHRTAE